MWTHGCRELQPRAGISQRLRRSKRSSVGRSRRVACKAEPQRLAFKAGGVQRRSRSVWRSRRVACKAGPQRVAFKGGGFAQNVLGTATLGYAVGCEARLCRAVAGEN